MTPDSRDEIVVSFLFGSMGARALDVATFLDELPRLCRGALADCHVGASTTADPLVCPARFRCAPPDPTRRQPRVLGLAPRGDRRLRGRGGGRVLPAA